MDCELDNFLALVDPELKAIALQLRQVTQQFTPMTLSKLAKRRQMLSAMVAPLQPDVPAREIRIPGHGTAPDIPAWIVNEGAAQAGAARAAPAILHMHGGGFTASSARASVPHLQSMAKLLGCTIVSVDFRNAPETRFDGSLEDNYAALQWTYHHAQELGIDRTRIAVMGESGGGGHAALLAIAARDRGDIPLLFQALIYPMLDDCTGSAHKPPSHLGAFNWNADANRFGWSCFLGEQPGTQSVPSSAVPARVQNLAGLPPTFIAVGTLDLFVDENLSYAGRLIDAGVPTEVHLAPGCFHGFDLIAKDTAAAQRFTAAKVGALQRAFAVA